MKFRFIPLLFIAGVYLFQFAAIVAVAQPQETPRDATPDEIRAGLGLIPQPFTTLVVSNDGRWVSFETTRGQAFLDLQTGKRLNARKGWQTRNAFWSPSGSTMAFLVYKEGRIFLHVWEPGTDQDCELLAFPRKMYPVRPVWSPDGKTLYMVLNLDLPWSKSRPEDDNPPTESENAHLTVTGPYRDSTEYQRFKKLHQDAYAENQRTLILGIDLASGEMRLVGKGNDVDSLYPSPDGKWLALVQVKGKEVQATGQILADLYVISLPPFADLVAVDLEKFDDRTAGWIDSAGHPLSPVLKDICLNDGNFWGPMMAPPKRMFDGNGGNPLLVWSPDSTRFAYATTGRKAKGDVFIYDPAAKALVNLTGQVLLAPWSKDLGFGDDLTWKYNSLRFGSLFPPLWMPDGKSLVVLGHGDVWSIPVDPAAAARNLTKELSLETVRIVPTTARDVAVVDASGRLVILAKDKASRMDSVFKLDPASGKTTLIADLGVWVGLQLAADQAAGELVYVAHTEKTDQNIFRLALNPGAAPENLTGFKMQLADRRYPYLRRLQWKTEAGAMAFGLLYLPPGTVADHRVPMVLDGTPGSWQSRVDDQERNGAWWLRDSVLGFLKDGIAVLDPDIPMSDYGEYEHPMKQVVDGVNRAVDAALATGLIDESRLGILGDGYGGFMVQGVVSQDDRFKAAVSIGGVSDWTADYLGGSAIHRASWYEGNGEGRFAVPPWEDPARYVENSPFTHLDRVHTPLLLIHGENDPAYPIARDQQTFRSLDRLNRTVIFSTEKRWAAGARDEEIIRIRAWFAEYLLGAKPTAHIAKTPSFFFSAP